MRTRRDQKSLNNFRFDAHEVDWKDFITAGCYYKLLDVNVGARTLLCAMPYAET